jgi:hypothetical protein
MLHRIYLQSALVLLIFLEPSLALARQYLPIPIINSTTLQAAPSQDLQILGQGFINTRPAQHIVHLFSDNSARKIRIKVLAATKESLEVLLPKQLAYGQYHLAIKLKTRYLQSKRALYYNILEIRPRAPSSPRLAYRVLSNLDDLDYIFYDKDLHFDRDLKLGLNQIKTYYIKDDYKSSYSDPVNVYYFPRTLMDSVIEKFASTYKIFTQDRSLDFDVTHLIATEQEGLRLHHYLSTPSEARYLETIEKLSAVYISAITITGDEEATLTNRDRFVFSLANCFLKDDIRARYHFGEQEYILAGQSLTVKQNLGLNDTSPDSLSLFCNDTLIDKYSY